MKIFDTFYILRTSSSQAAIFLVRCGVKINPNWLTFLSSLFYVISVYLALNENYLCILIIILSLFFDFLDGDYARLTNRTSKLGRAIDELSDSAKIPILIIVYFLSIEEQIIAITIAALWISILRMKLLVKNLEDLTEKHVGQSMSNNSPIVSSALKLVPQLYYANFEIIMIFLIVSGSYMLSWIFVLLMLINLLRILKKYVGLLLT